VTEYLTYEDVIVIHDAIAEPGVRDAGIIMSAIGRPQQSVFGEDAYPDIWQKAGALLHSLARNHGFVDGNKRTAWVSMETFLMINGERLDPFLSEDDAEAFALDVAEGRADDIPDIAARLQGWSVPVPDSPATEVPLHESGEAS
jgi:death-on-curing protein